MCDSPPRGPGLAHSTCSRNICWSKLDHFTASADIVSGTAACQFLRYSSTLQILWTSHWQRPHCLAIKSCHSTARPCVPGPGLPSPISAHGQRKPLPENQGNTYWNNSLFTISPALTSWTCAPNSLRVLGVSEESELLMSRDHVISTSISPA